MSGIINMAFVCFASGILAIAAVGIVIFVFIGKKENN